MGPGTKIRGENCYPQMDFEGVTELNYSRPPVFLGHCLTCTSAVFAFGPPENSLAYLIADAGAFALLLNFFLFSINNPAIS